MFYNVNDLPENTSMNDSDFLLADNGEETFKISKEKLLEGVNNRINNIATTGGGSGSGSSMSTGGGISVAHFGAVGDGSTDDTAAIQAAIDYAESSGIRHVYLEGKEYKTSSSINLPSKFVFEGVYGQTSIKLKSGVNKPVLNHRGEPLGELCIKNMVLYGNQDAGSNNHGIYINDYWSQIRDVEITNCGGCGIKWHTTDAKGTLVENRIENVRVRSCMGNSFDLGEDDNNKITDGFLINCLSHGTHSASNKAVKIGSAAGWVINGLHTYAHDGCTAPLEINNAFATLIDNIYIEDFTGRAVNFKKAQNNLCVSNVTVRIDKSLADASIFYVSKTGWTDYPANVILQNILLENKNTGKTYVVDGDGSSINVLLSNVSTSGSNRSGWSAAASGVKSMVSVGSGVSASAVESISMDALAAEERIAALEAENKELKDELAAIKAHLGL